ncbi:hypothetical protein CMQ_813 [Grosmannia clavigera kw1407]|uniref:Uncharacterized protein n=1 Tax=Grosmannia clavigera (strain kw1407 / UAMH 11150) TaxID=655863 RepID=F0XDB5_GROCL|nr:uncharacterized protein CMQ_813 [Grosmannia clavigera kw1407]EFX03885.1 hypothetical protein CMQ_813 [Grosmannia clavigera kw1407]
MRLGVEHAVRSRTTHGAAYERARLRFEDADHTAHRYSSMFRPRIGRRPMVGDLVGLMAMGGSMRRAAATQASQRLGPRALLSQWDRQTSRPQPPVLRASRSSDRRRAMATTAGAAAGLPDLDRVVTVVRGARTRLLDHPGVPSEDETATALQICGAAADLIMDASVQPQLNNMDHQADTAASTLLSLEGRSTTECVAETPTCTPDTASTSAPDSTAAGSPRLRDVVGQISDAAYAVIEDRRVHITPQLLAQYVAIQARLGRPASLPHVLALFASKPVPRARNAGQVHYQPQNPRRPGAAVDPDVAEAALDAALAARDLDAAVGVVEHSFAAAGFVRNKLLHKGFLPGFAVVAVPLATYSLATQLAAVQTTLDDGAATAMAFAAILAYVGFTGAIGAVANATANDQMRRVTWSPGTPLRERWLREDERAAFDKVTCAFGFTDAYRYGEEEGADFQALREYVMRKGMLIDQNEMLEGMSS